MLTYIHYKLKKSDPNNYHKINSNYKAKKLYIRVGYTVFKERDHDCIMRKFLL